MDPIAAQQVASDGYHVLVATFSGVLGALLTYVVGVVRLKDKINEIVNAKFSDMVSHCESCRAECKGVRAMKENDLSGRITASEREFNLKLAQGTKQFTYIRLLLEDVICEKLEIPKERLERIQRISGVGTIE